MPLNCGVGEDSWESFGLQGDPNSPSWRKSFLNIPWNDWCWTWNANTFVTWCEGLTHLKRPWCWERLKAGGEGDDRRWDGWMASLTQWTSAGASSGRWWRTGKPGVLQSMGSQRVRHNWVTEVNWTELSRDQREIGAKICASWNFHLIWASKGLSKHHRMLGMPDDLLSCGVSVHSFISGTCVQCLLNAEHYFQYFNNSKFHFKIFNWRIIALRYC